MPTPHSVLRSFSPRLYCDSYRFVLRWGKNGREISVHVHLTFALACLVVQTAGGDLNRIVPRFGPGMMNAVSFQLHPVAEFPVPGEGGMGCIRVRHKPDAIARLS